MAKSDYHETDCIISMGRLRIARVVYSTVLKNTETSWMVISKQSEVSIPTVHHSIVFTSYAY